MRHPFIVCSLALFAVGAVAKPAPKSSVHEIPMEAVKGADGKTHWMPESVEVHPGEKVRFLLSVKTQGEPNFHGFQIRELNITTKAEREKGVTTVDAEIPADLKEGEYAIGCQFHPGHVGAKMVVAAHSHDGHAEAKPLGVDASKVKAHPLPPGKGHKDNAILKDSKEIPGEPK